MTDLEMTRLCAEAMGYTIIAERAANAELDYDAMILVKKLDSPYWPLHNDAQAMALVKKLHINCGFYNDMWCAVSEGVVIDRHSTDLNRAIVECVAKMQREKRK